jgi:carnitine 3-dehydrogenase
VSAGRRAAIIGGGVIGGGWAARFLLNGWDVALYDPDPEAARRVGEVIEAARRSLPALYDRALPPEGRLSVAASLADAVAGADWAQESAPERLDLKRRVLGEIAAVAAPQAVVASSTSGFRPSQLTAEGARAIVAHPFNPVYLLPLVELVGAPAETARAADILRGLGMAPLVLRREIDGHIADRLLEAVWREALWLVKDDVATTAEIDDAIRLGFGLRWARMGLFETYRIAGGEAGMAHFLAQFGPALKWPWSRLTDVPELDAALVARIAEQSDAQSGARPIRELERRRDDALVGVLRALRQGGEGAAAPILAHEATLPEPEPGALPITVDRQVPQAWTDFNGHMNEARYAEAGTQATDRFLELAGAGAGYVASGRSFFTVESHLTFREEVRAGERLRVSTQALAAEGRKLRLLHTLLRGERPAATVETLLVHVDLATRRASDPAPEVAARLAAAARDHAALPWPEAAGRAIGRTP